MTTTKTKGWRQLPSSLLATKLILTRLAEAPPRLVALTDGLTPAQLRAAPAPGEWSANEVLAHLRACADVWGDCIAAIVAEDRPTLRAVNPRTWVEKTDYRDLPFDASLRAFAARRAELLTALQSLPPEGWSRAATVTGAGRILERTVHSYAGWLARHERPHGKQIERIVVAVRCGSAGSLERKLNAPGAVGRDIGGHSAEELPAGARIRSLEATD